MAASTRPLALVACDDIFAENAVVFSINQPDRNRYLHRRVTAAVLVSLTAGMSCSSGDDNVTDPPNGECSVPASVPAGAVVVFIRDFAFVPAQVTVKSGGTVAWVNCAPANAESHTATSDVGAWDSPSIAPGAAFARTFIAQSGTAFDYHCIPHPFMKASVSIE